MRWYGQEQLEEQKGQISQEGLRLRERHAHVYANFIEQAEQTFRSGERETRLEEVQEEFENLRATLQWSLIPEGDPEVGVRIAGALYWFWLHEGSWSEGRNWLKKTLIAMNEDSASRARALHGLGILAWTQGDTFEATSLAQESIEVARRTGNTMILATSLRLLVQILLSRGNLETARDLAEESVSLVRQQGDTWNRASSLSTLGTVLRAQRLYDQARQLYEESLELFERTGDRWEQAGPLRNLGNLAFLQGNYDQAALWYKKSLALCQHIRGAWFLARGLEGLAKVDCAQGNYRRAVVLLAAAAQQREILGAVVLPTSQAEHAQAMSMTKSALGSEVFEEIWRKGKAMSAEQSIIYALHNDSTLL
jgi:tetratricopeptide (TPR) repeat protein